VASRSGKKLRRIVSSVPTLEKDDQITSNGQRHRSAEIFLNQRQGEVDARRYLGRGPNPAVLHENGIGLDMKQPAKSWRRFRPIERQILSMKSQCFCAITKRITR
jgi:hypothetical protein